MAAIRKKKQPTTKVLQSQPSILNDESISADVTIKKSSPAVATASKIVSEEELEEMKDILVERAIPVIIDSLNDLPTPASPNVETVKKILRDLVGPVVQDHLKKVADRLLLLEMSVGNLELQNISLGCKVDEVLEKLGNRPTEKTDESAAKICQKDSSWAAIVRGINPSPRTLPFTPAQAFAAATAFPSKRNPPVESAGNLYVELRSLPSRNATIGQRLTYVREALKHIDVSEGVLEISFIGGSMVHLIVDSDVIHDVEKKLKRAGILFEDYSPIDVSHSAAVLADHGLERMVSRVAALMNRARSHVACDAAIRSIPPVYWDKVTPLLSKRCRWLGFKK